MLREVDVDKWAAFRWSLLRNVYYLALLAIIVPPMIHFLPNYLNYGKFSPLEPADFIPYVQRNCVQTVLVIKQYVRDTGQYPDIQLKNLVPKYLPSVPFGQEVGEDDRIDSMRFDAPDYTWGAYTISYDFPAGNAEYMPQGWHVEGIYLKGPIPLPPVTLDGKPPPKDPFAK